MNSVQFGSNTFCGPAAVSIVAGITTDEAAALLTRITGKKRITGVYIHELKRAFESLGYKVQNQSIYSRTVFGNLFYCSDNGYYIFVVPSHFIVVEVSGKERFICDNHSKNPVNAASSVRLGDKAISCFRVFKS